MAVEDRGPQLAAIAIFFLIMSWIAVSLRCYVRKVLMKNFGPDDWLAVITLALFTMYCTFVLKGVQYGTGQHFANIPPENIPIALRWWWCCELAYVSSTAFLKASIGIFLIRICVKKYQIMAIWTVVGVVSLFSIYYFFLVVFQCSPVSFFWTQFAGATGGKCVNSKMITNSTYAHSAISAWADWTLGILPIFLVWDLAMNPRTKISVALILGIGALGSTATIVRIPYIKQLALDDFLYSTTDVAIWSTVEPGIGITASALATLRPLFRNFFSSSKLMGSSTNNYGSNGWPSSRKLSRAGYFRSGGSATKDGGEELGLRSDIAKGVGITTVIKSALSPEFLNRDASAGKVESSGTKTALQRNNVRETHLRDENSSEEFLSAQNPAGWGVRKTTQVTTSQEDR